MQSHTAQTATLFTRQRLVYCLLVVVRYAKFNWQEYFI